MRGMTFRKMRKLGMIGILFMVVMVVSLQGAFAGEKPELQNPKLVSDGDSQNTQWDTIYYGYYPQTEIVGEAGQCGIKTSLWKSETDYALEPEVYAKLEKARYTADGDTVLNGIKYRRMKAEDRTYISRGEIDNRYFWNTGIKYHYFRYEPIRWRVLYVQDTAKGKRAQLLADKILDDRKYNETQTDITWEKSTIRSWLNGYGAEANRDGQDYSKNGFIKTAFREVQQAPIVAGAWRIKTITTSALTAETTRRIESFFCRKMNCTGLGWRGIMGSLRHRTPVRRRMRGIWRTKAGALRAAPTPRRRDCGAITKRVLKETACGGCVPRGSSNGMPRLCATEALSATSEREWRPQTWEFVRPWF